MTNTFFVSDTHFGHEKTCTTFKNEDGSPLRPFANAQEMDEQMVLRWNAVVRPQDKVYHLGDVVINKKFLNIMFRLNGSKRLIRGNHDIMKTKDYMAKENENGTPMFSEVYGVRVLDDMILSHIPLHPDSVTERFGTNVHGHLHANQVMVEYEPDGKYDVYLGPGPFRHPDPRYLCVCVEHTDYTPISIDEVRDRIKVRRHKYNYVPPNKAWGNKANPG